MKFFSNTLKWFWTLAACRPQGQNFLGVQYMAGGFLMLTFYITI